jgi:hypothetical protein
MTPDEEWARALDCASSQFESYVRQGKVATSEERRAALGDALQHAYGLLRLSLNDLIDPPVCRLQFPDGGVPGNAKEAAEGWKKWADEFQRRWKAAEDELKDARYSGGADWAQMAADVDRGRGF